MVSLSICALYFKFPPYFALKKSSMLFVLLYLRSIHDMLIRYRPETSVPPLQAPSLSSVSQEDAGKGQ